MINFSFVYQTPYETRDGYQLSTELDHIFIGSNGRWSKLLYNTRKPLRGYREVLPSSLCR